MLALLLDLTADLDATLGQPSLSGAVVSAYVTNLNNEVVYQKNGSTHIIPASNQKLFTAAYALSILGPNYRPVTRIWKLHGRIVVDSSGDPMLTSKQLEEAASKLHIRRLPVYLHEAYRPGVPPSWEYDDLPNRYAARVTAFTMDQGGFELRNLDGRLKLVPANFGVRIQHLSGEKLRVEYDPQKKVVRVHGKYSGLTTVDTLAVPSPDEAAASFLGRYAGQTDEIPKSEPTLTITGPTLSETLHECLTKSDNNIAENLLLMSALHEGPLGEKPYATSTKRLKEFLVSKVGIDEADIRPDDGSGLSRHSFATTRALARLLSWEMNSPSASEWSSLMATSGEGTLKGRLAGIDFRGKTGTLDSVVALSGLVKTADGTSLVVSLVLNNFLVPTSAARALADEFVRKIGSSKIGGSHLDEELSVEDTPADQGSRLVRFHRFYRSCRNGNLACPRLDRRTQPRDASFYRKKRVAVRHRQGTDPFGWMGGAGVVRENQSFLRKESLDVGRGRLYVHLAYLVPGQSLGDRLSGFIGGRGRFPLGNVNSRFCLDTGS